VDDLEDACRSDGLTRSADDAELTKRIDDLPQLVTAIAHVANHRSYVLLVFVDFKSDTVFTEALAPGTLS
jgi:hypothetical protein